MPTVWTNRMRGECIYPQPGTPGAHPSGPTPLQRLIAYPHHAPGRVWSTARMLDRKRSLFGRRFSAPPTATIGLGRPMLRPASGSTRLPSSKFGPIRTRLVGLRQVRAMLAMRACRGSIMIGRALDKPQMYRILNNLTGLKSPWNCPHGRPTMRHLASLSFVVTAPHAQ